MCYLKDLVAIQVLLEAWAYLAGQVLFTNKLWILSKGLYTWMEEEILSTLRCLIICNVIKSIDCCLSTFMLVLIYSRQKQKEFWH